MRSLALLLLLANVVFFNWQLGLLPWLPWQPTQFEELPSLPPVSNLPRLVLVSEVESDPVAPIAASTPVIPVATEKVSPNSKLSVMADAKPLKMDSGSEGTLTKAKNTLESKSSDLATAPDNASPPTASKIITGTEPAILPKTPDTVQIPKVQSGQCFQSGPYTDRSVAKKAANGFKSSAGKVEVEVQERQSSEVANTWVYISPFASLQVAQQEARRLSPLGITDYKMVTTGALKNSISIGVFKSQENVQRLVQNLKAKGFKVVAEPRYDNHTTYWVKIKIAKDAMKSLEELKGQSQGKPVESVTCQ